jgi:hypothetical protein
MISVYESCPSFENERYLIRYVESTDVSDLLEVYFKSNRYNRNVS